MCREPHVTTSLKYILIGPVLSQRTHFQLLEKLCSYKYCSADPLPVLFITRLNLGYVN